MPEETSFFETSSGFRPPFRWVVENVLLPEIVEKEPLDPQDYFPLKASSGLFWALSETPCSKAGVIDFANRYGLLGLNGLDDREASREYEQVRGQRGSELPCQERLEGWMEEIEKLKWNVQLWDSIKKSDTSRFRQLIVRARTQLIAFDAAEKAAREGSHLPTPRRFLPHSLVLASLFRNRSLPLTNAATAIERNKVTSELALAIVLAAINETLQAGITRKRDTHVSIAVTAAPIGAVERRTSAFDLQAIPRSLLGAIWLQFAAAVAEEKHYRRCAMCRTYFELGAGVNRSDRKFCSDACRSKNYRKRK